MSYDLWDVTWCEIYWAIIFNRLIICDVLRDLVAFVQFKNVKNTHGGELLLVKLQAEAYVYICAYDPRHTECSNLTEARWA